MKNKKSVDLTMSSIVIAALAVLVLLVLALIFKDILFGTAGGIKDIGEQGISQAKGERCSSIFGVERACYATRCPQPKDTDPYSYIEVYGEFTDCPGKEPKKDKQGNILNTCCERVKKEKP